MKTLLLLLVTLSLAHAADPRPNFLLIVADDMCWRDIGCLGHPDVKTPRLDRLRSEGMYLNGMYSPAATCSPLRHALYTGLYPIRSGAYPNHTHVEDGTRSLFTYLNDMGYRTALQNKEHVGPRASFPYRHIPGADDLTQTRAFVTEKAEQPWLLVFASNDPHSPWTRGPQDLYVPSELTLPPHLHDNAETRAALAAYYAEISQLDFQVGALLDLLDETQQAQNTLVLFVSEQGCSLPFGGKWSLYDTGIHAAAFLRWPGKVAPGSESDALLQYVDVTPTFLQIAGSDPDKIDTGRPDASGHTGFDGQSFLPILLGQSRHLRDYVFSQHTTVGVNGYRDPYPSRMARDERYKLILNLTPQNTFWIGGIHEDSVFESWQRDAQSNPQLAQRVDWLMHRPEIEIYDLETDPLELTNLAGKPEVQAVEERLRSQLDAWMKQQGDQGLPTELDAPQHQSGARAANAGRKGKGKAKAKSKAKARPKS
ncbi:MAG: sulfatase [Verrucomicrobiales bacterium]|nr:sulfatase [Verrucomicrobiales bacterium]